MTEERPVGEVTRLLEEASRGNKAAFDRVIPLVYDELRRVARNRLSVEPSGHTLDTTALVHEAYLKLVGQSRVDWQGRPHFFAVASEAMRRVLVDHARRRSAQKRGDGQLVARLDEAEDRPGLEWFSPAQADELLALDDALDRLAAFNPSGASVVQHRFFGGLSCQEVARLTGSSERTVQRTWSVAKAWLRQELVGHRSDGASSLLGSGPDR